MNDCLKAFFLGLSTGTLVGLLFDLSQERYSQKAFEEGWLAGYSRAQDPRIVRTRRGLTVLKR
ncbi:MAG: hypothetical protein C5B58_10595 [Acidobacteria bacterium]|nr:MAG: hypothetical protein C5B58_10595 [Acidobacteriota bacterium]